MSTPIRVGIIDIGSNSIKLLIAESLGQKGIRQVLFELEEVRIGEGMTGNPPCIDSNAIENGCQAVSRLHAIASEHELQRLAIVATSAVRDAHNKSELMKAVANATGLEIQILTGQEEARLIGKGVRQDPALTDLINFTLADLGGGSMECIQFQQAIPLVSHSFNLGAVRLTSRYINNRMIPLTDTERAQITSEVRSTLTNSPIQPRSDLKAVVLTGGSASLLASLAPHSNGIQSISIDKAKEIRDRVCQLSGEERIAQLGIPPNRADIFPAATLILCELLDYLECESVYTSIFNLRYGLAAEMMEALRSIES